MGLRGTEFICCLAIGFVILGYLIDSAPFMVFCSLGAGIAAGLSVVQRFIESEQRTIYRKELILQEKKNDSTTKREDPDT